MGENGRTPRALRPADSDRGNQLPRHTGGRAPQTGRRPALPGGGRRGTPAPRAGAPDGLRRLRLLRGRERRRGAGAAGAGAGDPARDQRPADAAHGRDRAAPRDPRAPPRHGGGHDHRQRGRGRRGELSGARRDGLPDQALPPRRGARADPPGHGEARAGAGEPRLPAAARAAGGGAGAPTGADLHRRDLGARRGAGGEGPVHARALGARQPLRLGDRARDGGGQGAAAADRAGRARARHRQDRRARGGAEQARPAHPGGVPAHHGAPDAGVAHPVPAAGRRAGDPERRAVAPRALRRPRAPRRPGVRRHRLRGAHRRGGRRVRRGGGGWGDRARRKLRQRLGGTRDGGWGGDAGRDWTGAWCGAGDVAGTRGGRRAQRPPGIPIVNGPTANPTLPAHPASRIPHPAMDTLRQDLSFALRTLRRDAAFALVAVFTLAVGIGAATVMFGVLRAVLLRPLPVREQERVLVMWGANARLDRTRVPIGGEAYRRYARESRALAGAAAVEYHGATEWVVRQDAAVERLRGALVSGNYFRVLGTRAGLGRTLEAADDVRGASPVLVISDRLWRRRYGGDPGAVGRQVEIVLTGRRFTIVGVMPPGVEYPRGADIWVPFATYLPPAMDSLSDRFLNVYLVGRLSRGATEERARAELASLLRGERSPFPPDFRAGMTAVATTLPALVLGDARRAL